MEIFFIKVLFCYSTVILYLNYLNYLQNASLPYLLLWFCCPVFPQSAPACLMAAECCWPIAWRPRWGARWRPGGGCGHSDHPSPNIPLQGTYGETFGHFYKLWIITYKLLHIVKIMAITSVGPSLFYQVREALLGSSNIKNLYPPLTSPATSSCYHNNVPWWNLDIAGGSEKLILWTGVYY